MAYAWAMRSAVRTELAALSRKLLVGHRMGIGWAPDGHATVHCASTNTVSNGKRMQKRDGGMAVAVFLGGSIGVHPSLPRQAVGLSFRCEAWSRIVVGADTILLFSMATRTSLLYSIQSTLHCQAA